MRRHREANQHHGSSLSANRSSRAPLSLVIILAVLVSWSISVLRLMHYRCDFSSIDPTLVVGQMPDVASSALRFHWHTYPSHKHNFTAAICAVVKDSELYLTEWLDYNLLALEFDRVYLYDNSDNFELHAWYANTRTDQVYSRVEVIHQPGTFVGSEEEYVQKYAYKECINRYGKGMIGDKVWSDSPRHDYIALIDIDENIVLKQYPQQHRTIHDLLADYLAPYGGALALTWMLFGTANRTMYSPIPVTKRFQYRDEELTKMIKMIVKSEDFVSVENPHAVNVRMGTEIRDTLYPSSVARFVNEKHATNLNNVSKVAVLNHYRFLSEKEYVHRRCFRGEVDDSHNKGCKHGKINFDKAAYHVRPRPGTVFDNGAWRFLVDKVPKYRFFDSSEWKDYM